MRKRLIIALTLVMVIAFAIPAFADISYTEESEIANLYQQIVELRKEIVQKYVDAGEISPEQGELMQENMGQMYENKKSQGFKNPNGFGCGGGGMMGGYGYGGGMMGGNGPGAGMMGL